MFGLSLSKALFTVVAVALVWFGWKWVSRMQERRRDELNEGGQRTVRRNRTAEPRRRARRAATEDLVACRVCGSYVPARGGQACDRADCPFSNGVG